MKTFLEALLSPRAPRKARPRVHLESWPELVYAIGDVHGCYDLLRDLEARIVADARDRAGEKLIVMLGDYVDRGDRSAQVLDHLLADPPKSFNRICLAGNHEQMMLDFLEAPARSHAWLDNGGRLTLSSYGLEPGHLGAGRQLRVMLDAHIPENHRSFISGLPACLTLPGAVFVHAGLRPNLALEDQRDEDLLWIRREADTGEMRAFTIVHGHTPAPEPQITSNRIGLDTGAYGSGVLTAARFEQGRFAGFLQATSARPTSSGRS